MDRPTRRLTANNPLDLFSLEGRVALVTGGSRGLGAVIAEAFSWAGADVAITSRKLEEVERQADAISRLTGRRVEAIEADVSDRVAVDRSLDKTVDAFGSLDILVNNAGTNVRGPIGDLDPDDFQESLSVNVVGPWLMCRAAQDLLVSSEGGRVINIASTFGLVAAPNRTAYTSAKGALIQLTRALALEWAHTATTVNAIAPGPFLTEMNIPHQRSEHALRVIEHEVAMKRWGELHEIQGAALFLASAASSYVTGTVLTVDGGWTAH